MGRIAGRILIVLAVACVAVAGYTFAKAHYHDHVAACTVLAKDRSSSADAGGGNYDTWTVRTRRCGTLTVDSLWWRHTDPDRTWNALRVGGVYRLEIVGFRLSAVNTLPVIVRVVS